ncbi:cadherin-like domain-containing protein [Microvirga sp. BT689]|uniref:Ig-like domain-containing protein n=1 Tax=Microvirga arvi TaxID=2778731 RepID=UPI00194FE365|nr:Ig-like domain-containing protein [Microvirga arvi]MBM6583129.1 cadherin-like domain-containing protein [Microvirga arvi]
MTLVAAEKVAQLKAGVDKALSYIEKALSVQVLAQKLPFVGDKLKEAFDKAESTVNQIRDLKETIFKALNDLNNLPEYAEAQIETAINDALKAADFLKTVADVVVSGTDVQINFTCDEARNITLDLASDLGLGGLGINTSGQVQVDLSCQFNFTVGADASGTDAFYLVTNGGAPELALGISVTAPQLAADASLGFLNFNATDMGSLVTGAFTVDLKADADGKLRLSEVDNGVDVLDATFTGQADIDIHLSGDMGAANLPKISADLAVDWAFNNSTVNPDGGQAFGGTPKVVFNNVSYDFGTFIEDFIKPILAHLDPVLQPIDQALAIFRTDLTFLKVFPNWEGVFDKAGADVGGIDAADGKITLIDFVKMAQPSANLTAAVGFIELVDDIVDWAAFFQDKTFGPDEYDLGSFEILEDIRDAAVFLEGIAPDALNAVGNIPNLATFLGGLTGGGYSAVDGRGQSGQDILEDMLLGDFFKFPILTNPMEAFHFLLGGQADLFSLDLPALSFNFGGDLGPDGSPLGDLADLAIFPVVPGIDIKLEGAIDVAMDMAFGFDTRGLLQFKASGYTDYARVFNGFFVSDQQGAGGDLPEASLSVLLQLAVSASIPLATVGGAGNIAGQILLNLNDIVNGTPADGKIYLDEMGNALLTNPFGIFDMSGQITAGFAAFVNVAGYDLWRYNSPRYTLGGFSFSDVPPVAVGDTPPPPPDLGTIEGTTLVLNIGDRAQYRATSNTSDGDESFEIGGSSGTVSVLAFSRSQQFTDITGIVANGGAGDDAILLAASLDISATLDGGSGTDYLYGGAAADVIRGGDGRDYLHGRDGGDRLDGQDGDDVLDGGAGADILDGGADFDIVTYENSTAAIFIDREKGQASGGDAEGDAYLNVEVFEGSNIGNDTMLGSAGSDIFLGLLGDDRLEGRAGNDVLLGGEGVDNLLGGLDEDTLYGGGGNDTLDGGEGADVLKGGAGDDLYLVNHQGDSVHDHDGADAGGYDRVISSVNTTLAEGSGIEELVLTGPARVGTGNSDKNLIIGTDGADTLNGSGGADTLGGGAGNDTYVFDSLGDRVLEVADNGTDEIHLLTGGLSTGSTFSLDTEWGAQVENVTLADDVHGVNLTGNSLDNVLVGNRGANFLSGLAGDDTIVSGHSGATKDDTLSDQAYGGEGFDHLIVDWSDLTVGAHFAGSSGQGTDGYYGTSYIDNSSRLYHSGVERFTVTTGAGADLVEVGTADDVVATGAGNDTIRSGTGKDQVDGGTGTDTWKADWSDVTQAIVLDLNASNTVLADGRYVKSVERLEEFRTGTGAFNDVITLHGDASIGADTVYTHDGSDTVSVFAGTTQGDTASDAVYMGTGTDDHLIVDWSDLTVGAHFAGSSGQGTDGYYGTSYIDNSSRLYHSGVERFTVTTGAGADLVEVGTADDVVATGAGNDSMWGGAGDDSLSGGDGNDRLEGSAGNDTLQGGDGDGDTAVFRGSRADYIFEIHRDGTILITDQREGGDGQDTIEGIELLQFWDGTARLNTIKLEDQSIGEDEHWSFQIPEGFDPNQAEGLDYSISLAGGTVLPGWLTFDTETRTFSGTPPLNFNGVIDLTIVARNDVLVALSSLRLAVEAVNDAPLAGASGNSASGVEDRIITGQVPAGTDVDGDDLTYQLVSPVAGLDFNPDGTFTYTPAANFHGTVAFEYEVVDAVGDKSEAKAFTLNLTPVNDAPSDIILSNAAVAENASSGTAVGSLAAFDPDGDAAFIFGLLDDAGGRFMLGADSKSIVIKNGSLLDYEQATSHQVVVQATDATGVSYSKALTIVLQDIVKETTTGTAGNDTVSGGSGTDNLSGGAGNDSLDGGGGKDKINGGTGNDRIIGGTGQDTLTGGTGKDVFMFASKDTGTSKSTADYITDFSGKGGDKIDLKLIDTDTKKKGDQAFSFIGKDAFTKAGQVRYEKSGKDTYVYLNTDSDKTAEGVIKLKGAMDFSKGWFVL